MMQRKNSIESGFTLIELLVVMAILSVLISITAVVAGPFRDKSTFLKCATNLRSMYTAIIIHNESRGGYPEGGTPNFWNCLRGKPKDLPQPIAQDNRVFICPFLPYGDAPESDATRLDYTYPTKLPRVDDTNAYRVIARDKLSNHGRFDTINVLMVRGSVEKVNKTTDLFDQIAAGEEPYGVQLGDDTPTDTKVK